jgi:hypothetical protein
MSLPGSSQKAEAIKDFREHTGARQRDAEAAIDDIQRNLG